MTDNLLQSSVQCGDSTELIRKLPDNSVDLLLSDIPYGIGLDDWDVLHANTNSAYGGKNNIGLQMRGVILKPTIELKDIEIIDNLYLLSTETQTIEFLTKGNQIKKIIFLDNLGYRHEITLSLKHG